MMNKLKKNVMRQILLLLVSFFILHSLQSQDDKITKDLESFVEVKGFDGLSINLIKSDVNKAIITGANTNKVAIVNKDGVLKLRMKIDKIFSGYRTFIDLYYTEKKLNLILTNSNL